ncbi:hypothetical protein ACFL4L_00760 [bacterium]
MYSVCYQHNLKPGKTLQDFRKWLKQYWQMQQSWGATQVKLHEHHKDNHAVIHCEYYVNNIKNWTMHAIGTNTEKWLQDLEAISDIQSITIMPNKPMKHHTA